jgi:hypothetical protein
MIKQSKKILLMKFMDFTCEICKKEFEESDLHIHRIKRGCDYNCFRSLMVLCQKCHIKLHENEFKSNCSIK